MQMIFKSLVYGIVKETFLLDSICMLFFSFRGFITLYDLSYFIWHITQIRTFSQMPLVKGIKRCFPNGIVPKIIFFKYISIPNTFFLLIKSFIRYTFFRAYRAEDAI